jgi:hypothetical protein
MILHLEQSNIRIAFNQNLSNNYQERSLFHGGLPEVKMFDELMSRMGQV